MNPPLNALEPLRFVVLKSERLYGELIRHYLWSLWPDAGVQVFQRGLEALEAVQDRPPDLFITGLKIADMDGLEHVEPFKATSLPIFVVTTRPDPHAFAMLRNVRCEGVFDAIAEGLENLPAALRLVMRHQHYVSPSFSEQLKPIKNPDLDTLTKTQRLVFAVIGDGSDNEKASKRLNMAAETVGTHRKAIMKKLKIHHKGDLMRIALEQGFVVKTPLGVVSPGFQRIIEERVKRKKKPPASPTPDESMADGNAAVA